MVVAHGELRHRKRAAANEARRPDLHHSAPADLCSDKPKGDDEREERKLPPGHRAELHEVQPRHIRHRAERNTDTAKCHRRGIADECKLRGLQRLETKKIISATR